MVTKFPKRNPNEINEHFSMLAVSELYSTAHVKIPPV